MRLLSTRSQRFWYSRIRVPGRSNTIRTRYIWTVNAEEKKYQFSKIYGTRGQGPRGMRRRCEHTEISSTWEATVRPTGTPTTADSSLLWKELHCCTLINFVDTAVTVTKATIRNHGNAIPLKRKRGQPGTWLCTAGKRAVRWRIYDWLCFCTQHF